MKRIGKLAALLSALLLVTVPVMLCAARPTQAGETGLFRAVWVSTVYNIDYPSAQGLSAGQLRDEADAVLDNCADMGMSAVFLQVRPSADALYPSAYFPWSKYISGTQGTAPDGGLDLLAYWVEAAHARGLELHAWINPYRITTGKEAEWETVSESHPAKQNPDWAAQSSDGNYYFNPGVPEVRDYIRDAALEIVTQYEVDGLHMDDYFYPSDAFDDSAQYEQYGGGLSLEDWRRSNVDAQVRVLFEAVKEAKPAVSFGISPTGIWANQSTMPEGSATRGNESYTAHRADTRKWVKEGWLDYICPQLYWNIGYEIADYATLAHWWADVVRGTNVKLYIGIADYRTGDDDETSPWHGISAVKDQLALNRTIPEIAGEAHFSYRNLAANGELWGFYRRAYAAEPSVQATAPPEAETGLWLDTQHRGAYMQGDAGQFRPEATLTRAEVATLLSRVAVDEAGAHAYGGETPDTAPFPDVAADRWYAGPIAFLSRFGVVVGDDDGNFRPEGAITRAELLAIACRMSLAFEPVADAGAAETPVWAADYIGYARSAGWLEGISGSMEEPVTRAETVAILNRAMDRVPDEAAIAVRTDLAVFSDVPPDHPAYFEVMEAANGWD